GVQEREVHVVINPAKLAQYGLSVSEVVAAIQSANISSPIGSLSIDGVDYSLTLEGEIVSGSEIGGIAMKSRSGTTVYVRDVATVSEGVAKARTLARVSEDGEPSQPSLTLNVYKSSGGNIVAVAERVKERLTELEEEGVIEGNVVFAYDAGEQVGEDLT